MGAFADELRDGMGEAARKLAEALLVDDDQGAEAYRERLLFLRRVAARHGVGSPPGPRPATGGEAAADPVVTRHSLWAGLRYSWVMSGTHND